MLPSFDRSFDRSFDPSLDPDDSSFAVADVRGRVLARNLTLAQLAARVEAGLLPTAALAAAEGDAQWRPLHEILGSGARRSFGGVGREVSSWFVAVGERVVGPVDTDCLRRGIAAGRVPRDAKVCPAGERTWYGLDDTGIFADALFDVMETQYIAPTGGPRRADPAWAVRSSRPLPSLPAPRTPTPLRPPPAPRR